MVVLIPKTYVWWLGLILRGGQGARRGPVCQVPGGRAARGYAAGAALEGLAAELPAA